MENPQEKKPKLSDDAVDGIAAVILIVLLVAAVVIWLQSMP
jgi:hypothetical protein